MEKKDFNYRLLLVDDDQRIISTSRALLRGLDFEVRTASDGFEALAIMRKITPDLIITDLAMPKMSGFEFLSVVRRRFPKIPVIVVSAEFSIKSEGLLSDAYFEKGQYEQKDLLNKVAELLETERTRTRVEKSPIWIPKKGEYFVLTCVECLRSFSVLCEEVKNGLNSEPCIYCGTKLHFILDKER